MFRAALAAAVVAAVRGDAVVVGSTALRLRGEDLIVRDLDLVPAPGPANMARFRRALASLGVIGELPSVAQLEHVLVVSLATSYGPVDVLAGRGREEHARLHDRASVITVAGVPVTVASAEDAHDLRRRFKDLSHG